MLFQLLRNSVCYSIGETGRAISRLEGDAFRCSTLAGRPQTGFLL